MSKDDDMSKASTATPEKVWAQIGQRKRSFATREEALAALQKFTDRMNKPRGHTKRADENR